MNPRISLVQILLCTGGFTDEFKNHRVWVFHFLLSVCPGKPLVVETLVEPLTDVGHTSATIFTEANNVVGCASATSVSLALIVYLSLTAFAGLKSAKLGRLQNSIMYHKIL